MEKSCILLGVLVILISLCSTVMSSNPDSIPVQGSSASKKHDVRKRDENFPDNFQGTGQPYSPRRQPYSVIRAMKEGSGITETVIRVLRSGSLLVTTKTYQNSQPISFNAHKTSNGGSPIEPRAFNRDVASPGSRPDPSNLHNSQFNPNADRSGGPFSNSDPNFSNSHSATPYGATWGGSHQPNFNNNPGGYPPNVSPNDNYPNYDQVTFEIDGKLPNTAHSTDRNINNGNNGRPSSDDQTHRDRPIPTRVGNRRTNRWQNPQGSRNDPNSSRGSGYPPSVVGNTNKKVSPDSSLYAEIVNDFAFKLIKAMNLESNFVISPLSVFIALSMCYLGAEGSTKSQLEIALGLNKKAVHGEKLHKGIHDLISSVLPQSEESQLYLANGMFLGKNFEVNSEFQRQIQSFYNANLQNLDFANPGQSMEVINDWVSKATRNMIRSITDSQPSPVTRLFLLNAIFFKGIWKTQFPMAMTFNGRFFTLNGDEKKVQTMVLHNETFPFYKSDQHRHSFIKLPYLGDEIAMVVALPHSFREKPLTLESDQMCSIRDSMKETRMDSINIPRFRFEFSISLKELLQRQGITDLFSQGLVNLSKMRSQNDVFVDGIRQKAVIEVNEQGSSAAAVTTVKLVPLTYKNTTDFLANHPFAFYIIHEPTGLVLFYGKMYDIGDASPSRGGEDDSSRYRNGEDTATRNRGSEDTRSRGEDNSRYRGEDNSRNRGGDENMSQPPRAEVSPSSGSRPLENTGSWNRGNNYG